MNRFREDTPYVFRPPKYSRIWAPLLYWLSDVLFLRRRYRIRRVEVASGGEEVVRRYRRGDSLLVTPNHSDHGDPHVLLHLSRRYRIPIHFMAAREIFEKTGGLQGALLQRAGVFSIDREGTDLRSIKEAMRILGEGRYPLVMFPEGEIYHLNERLTSLNEGAATLALRAAKRMRKDRPGSQALIVPTALRYRYAQDIASSFPERMARLERRILWAPQTGPDMVERVYKFGEALLSLKEKEYLNRTLAGGLTERLRAFRDILVREEEQRYFGKAGEGAPPTRVRRLRGKIRSILLDGPKPDQAVIAPCYRSLDRLYVAVQLYSYPGQYLRERRSADRIAETIHKFEEDLFGENVIRAGRTVAVTFCDPIDLSEYAARYDADSKATVAEVTLRVESAIRSVLEADWAGQTANG